MNKTNKTLLVIFLITLLLLVMFINSRPMPDEGHYLSYALYAGRGETPYKDYFDHHGIGMTLTFQLIAEQINIQQAKLIIIILNSINVCLIFLISKKIYDYNTAIMSALYFMVFIPIFGGVWVINENVMLFLLLIVLFLLTHYKTNVCLLLAGIITTTIPLFKQTFVWFVVPIIGFLWLKKRNIKMYFAGMTITIFLFGLYVFLTNDVNVIYQHLIVYNIDNAKLLMRMLSVKEMLVCVVMLLPLIGFLLIKIKQEMTVIQKTVLAVGLLTLTNLFPFAGLSRLIIFLGVMAIPMGGYLNQIKEYNKKILIIVITIFLLTLSVCVLVYSLKDDYSELENITVKLKKYDSPLFVYPAVPELYFMTKSSHASRHLWVWYWDAQDKYQEEIVSQLKSKEHVFVYFKALTEDEPNKINQYVKTNCELKETIRLEKALYNTFIKTEIYECNKNKFVLEEKK